MKRINSLSDLLMEELANLLNAENQLIEALPKMEEASRSSALRSILRDHLRITKEHAHRLKDVFSDTMQDPQEWACKAVEGFIQESKDVVNNIENGQARDIAIIDIMQQVEQYEISGYWTASEHAGDLGHTRIVELLNEIINEERAMGLRLSELAQGMINVQASGGFYIPEGKLSRGRAKKKNKSTDVSRFISEGNPNIQEDSDKDKG